MTGNDQSRLHLQGERIKRKTPKQVRITPSITVIKRKELNLLSGTIINDSSTNNLNNILGIGTF